MLSSCHQIHGDSTMVKSLAESLMVTLSEIIASVLQTGIEHESFIQVASYLYRASLIIKELQATENMSVNVGETLQSLSKRINMAKDLLRRFQQSKERIPMHIFNYIIKQLEAIIHYVGETLSKFPSLAFGDKYSLIAVHSISEEMNMACFEVIPYHETIPYKLQLSEQSSLKSKAEMALIPTESDVNSMSSEVSIEDPILSDLPQPVEVLKTNSKTQKIKRNMIMESSSSRRTVHIAEPLYKRH